MTAALPFELGASLARVMAASNGYLIDCRGPFAARRYHFVSLGEKAEFAIVLRDSGWSLRFGDGAEPVQTLVLELSDEVPL